MTGYMKTALKKIPLFSRLLRLWRNRKFLDRQSTLIYIHIGKCGGASLWRAVKDSELVKSQFKQVERIHISKPPVLRRANYLVIVRNPIMRMISAFNWRYKLVVDDEVQKNRFEGEYEILTKYGTLNRLAESLYTNDQLNQDVADEFRTVHHLKEDIAYYLADLLPNLKREQIFCVLATETLDRDVERLLNVKSIPRTHENSSTAPKEKKYLSDIAYGNLKRFLKNDYECIERLLELNHSTIASSDELLR